MKLYIGLDPGQNGSISFHPEIGRPWAIKMPETDKELMDTLCAYGDACLDYESVAMLEQVHSMPGQGVSSSFKFGEGYGKLQMALCAAGIPYQRVTPQKWQKDLQCLTKGDKNVSKRRAQELFPAIKVTHAIADGLLIGLYCKRHWK
jgi:crossover junction endodeoxyribonuclease RuvC